MYRVEGLCTNERDCVQMREGVYRGTVYRGAVYRGALYRVEGLCTNERDHVQSRGTVYRGEGPCTEERDRVCAYTCTHILVLLKLISSMVRFTLHST